MKDLKLNKESVSTLKEDQLNESIGAGPGDHPVSCERKSCTDDNGKWEVSIDW